MLIKLLFHLGITIVTAFFIWHIFPACVQAVRKISALWFQQRAKKLCRDQWPETLLLMGAALKAGLTLDEAFEIMVKESPEPLRNLLQHRLERGGDWIALVDRANLIFAESYLGVLKRSFILASQTGASYIPILESQALILRKKQMMPNISPSNTSAW